MVRTRTSPAGEVPARDAAPAGRRPFRDNPRLILLGIVLLLTALASLVWLADRSARLSPDFLTGFVLYALSATNFMMLLALGFFLARNVIKLVVERRRALPFARFRAKLVALLLGLTLIPGGAGAGRRIAGRAHRRGPLVQRADGGGAVVGEPDRVRLLPSSASGW